MPDASPTKCCKSRYFAPEADALWKDLHNKRVGQMHKRSKIVGLAVLIVLLTAVRMLRASGWIDLAGQMLEPLLQKTGIPAECSALVLLKPLSGSGGLALGQEIMRDCGVDSYAGRVAAVMLGASETSLYTIGIYCGHLELKKTGYAIPAAILADFAAFISAALWVRWLG